MSTVRCTCVAGFPQSVASCPVHGQRTPETATGTPRVGEAQSVPVVDITATIRGLYEHAEQCREQALAADALAATFRREAGYLESLAANLDGAVGGPRD